MSQRNGEIMGERVYLYGYRCHAQLIRAHHQRRNKTAEQNRGMNILIPRCCRIAWFVVWVLGFVWLGCVVGEGREGMCVLT